MKPNGWSWHTPWCYCGDFQDLPMWRRDVASFAIGLAQDYDRLLPVPMTLVRPEYLAEILGAIEAETPEQLVEAVLALVGPVGSRVVG